MGRFFLFTVVFAITLIVLFFPIFIGVSIYFDEKERKLVFNLNLYKKIKLKGGYFTRYEKGFVLHANKKKAILLPYKQLNSKRKAFSIVKTFEFISIKGVLEGNLEIISPFLILDKIFEQCKEINPWFQQFDFSFWVTEKNSLKFSVESIFFFTNFLLLLELFKFIRGKVKWLLKTTKSII